MPTKYRRLHRRIIGDANLAETSTYLSGGHHCLVLDLIEGGPALAWTWASDLALARRPCAVHVISRDPSLRATVALADDRELTGLALQRIYLDRVAALLDRRDPDPPPTDVVKTWGPCSVCWNAIPWNARVAGLANAKLRLLDGFRQRENLSWSAPGCSSSTCSTPTSGWTRGL